MKIYLAGFFIFLILTLFGLGFYNQSLASKTTAQAQARAAIITAQGQSRLDSAAANATNLSALFPYAVLVSSLILGVSVMALGVMIMLRPPPTAHRIERIETRTVVLIAPGQSRRELFRLIGGGDQWKTN